MHAITKIFHLEVRSAVAHYLDIFPISRTSLDFPL
jgi:hypothetical protein